MICNQFHLTHQRSHFLKWTLQSSSKQRHKGRKSTAIQRSKKEEILKS